MATLLTVQAIVNAPIDKVWAYWTQPEHITKWNFAADDWHCPNSTNDLVVGGKFSATMAAKDGSFSFDFWGIYDEITTNSLLKITMGDGRKMTVSFFDEDGSSTKIIEDFEAEMQNPIEMQQQGWQMILNNFKKYTEAN